MITEQMICDANEYLESCIEQLSSIDKDLIQAKFDLDTLEAEAMNSGAITGKNAEERKAQLRTMFLPERNAVTDLEAEKAVETRNADKMRSRLKSYYMLLWLQDITQKKGDE